MTGEHHQRVINEREYWSRSVPPYSRESDLPTTTKRCIRCEVCFLSTAVSEDASCDSNQPWWYLQAPPGARAGSAVRWLSSEEMVCAYDQRSMNSVLRCYVRSYLPFI